MMELSIENLFSLRSALCLDLLVCYGPAFLEAFSMADILWDVSVAFE